MPGGTTAVLYDLRSAMVFAGLVVGCAACGEEDPDTWLGTCGSQLSYQAPSLSDPAAQRCRSGTAWVTLQQCRGSVGSPCCYTFRESVNRGNGACSVEDTGGVTVWPDSSEPECLERGGIFRPHDEGPYPEPHAPISNCPDSSAIAAAGGSSPTESEPAEPQSAPEDSVAALSKERTEGVLARYAAGERSFRGEQLSYAYLLEANLRGADFGGADLQYARFTRANLEGVDFEDALLAHAQLDGADLSAANLTRADLQGVSAWMAVFDGAAAAEAGFVSAVLRSASMAGMQAERADFSDAFMLGADLSSAVLAQAKFSSAMLRGANLAEASMLTQAQLDEACGDASTRLPPDLTIEPCD